MRQTTVTKIDVEPTHKEIEDFAHKALGDVGGALTAALVVIGDKLGLYKALAATAPLTPAELAKRTETTERYVREWLNAQAAGGYVPTTRRRPLHAPAGAGGRARRRGEPGLRARGLPGMTAAMRADEPKIADDFKTGDGLGWREHHPVPVRGHRALLPPRATSATWSPRGSRRSTASQAKLERGAKVADVGCGLGASTIIMAKAFPNSTFVGFDYHAGVDRARARARRGRRRRRSRHASRSRAPKTSRARLRSGRALRLPARHGRSGRRRQARAPGARARRHVDDRRAVRRRPRRGEPQPGRPRLLLGVDAALHAGLARARSAWRSAHRPARRGCATSSSQGGFSASGARPRRRSTSCSKRVRDRHPETNEENDDETLAPHDPARRVCRRAARLVGDAAPRQRHPAAGGSGRPRPGRRLPPRIWC